MARRSLSWISVACASLIASACADLKTAAPSEEADGGATGTKDPAGPSGSGGDGGSNGTVSSGGGNVPAPGFGPGKYGALPTGYCCTANEECRQRRCADTPGGKMCLDDCRAESTCQRDGLDTFTCDGSPASPGSCKPPPGFACIPAAEFERGTKVAGECCTPTGDGNAGLECEGGLCIARGDGPFVCSNPCGQPKDCSGPFYCQPITESRKECFPANEPYACK